MPQSGPTWPGAQVCSSGPLAELEHLLPPPPPPKTETIELEGWEPLQRTKSKGPYGNTGIFQKERPHRGGDIPLSPSGGQPSPACRIKDKDLSQNLLTRAKGDNKCKCTSGNRRSSVVAGVVFKQQQGGQSGRRVYYFRFEFYNTIFQTFNHCIYLCKR